MNKQIKIKYLITLLILLILLILLPFTNHNVYALNNEDDVSLWNQNIDTKWYQEAKKEYHIKTAEQFASLHTFLIKDNPLYDDFYGKTIYIDTNIDLANYPFRRYN